MTKTAISWHPADIRAAIIKRGGTYKSVAEAAGISGTAVQTATQANCYVGEQAIASFLQVPAHEIWPSRYDSDGLPKHPRIRKQLNAANSGVKCQKELSA